MADRTRVQLIHDLTEAGRLSPTQLHDRARRILQAAPLAVQRGGCETKARRVVDRILGPLTDAELARLDDAEWDQYATMRGATYEWLREHFAPLAVAR